MGHSTASGRTGGGGDQRRTLSSEEREALLDRIRSGDVEARAAYRADRQLWRSDSERLDDIYSKRSEDETPAQTVEKFVRAVGEERAVNTIASLVNYNASDGRISRMTRSWASEQPRALSADDARGVVSTRMHMAHLEQVAAAMRQHQENSRIARWASEARQVGNDNFGQQVTRRNNRRR